MHLQVFLLPSQKYFLIIYGRFLLLFLSSLPIVISQMSCNVNIHPMSYITIVVIRLTFSVWFFSIRKREKSGNRFYCQSQRVIDQSKFNCDPECAFGNVSGYLIFYGYIRCSRCVIRLVEYGETDFTC